AVAAEAGEIHQIDILDISPLAQMLNQAAEGRRFKLCSGFVVDRHGDDPVSFGQDMAIRCASSLDFAISQRKQGVTRKFPDREKSTALAVDSARRPTRNRQSIEIASRI